MAEGASVPPLGLSNKAVYFGPEDRSGSVIKDMQNTDQSSDSYFIPQHLTGYSTMWREIYCG